MELVDDAETMALDGGHRAGRPAMRGHDPDRRPADLLLPRLADRRSCRSTRTTCSSTGSSRPAPATRGSSASWLFEPETIAAPGFDPSDAIAFWDLTNRQDWHVCELQQRGTRSRSWIAGRYSNQEPSVHAFDLMAVDRYADDGVGAAGPSARATTSRRPRTSCSNGRHPGDARCRARRGARPARGPRPGARPLRRARTPRRVSLTGQPSRRSGTDPRQSCAHPHRREEPWTTSPYSSRPSPSA